MTTLCSCGRTVHSSPTNPVTTMDGSRVEWANCACGSTRTILRRCCGHGRAESHGGVMTCMDCGHVWRTL